MTFSLRFSDVAELRNEKVDPATCSGSRYIGLEHIEQDSLSLSGWGTAEDVDSQKQRFYEGDILFGKLRPYFRKVVIAPFDGICSTDIWVVKPVIASDRDFVFYWMASDDFITRATNASEGTRMPRAKWDWVSGFELPEMPLEKRKIVGRILRVMDLTISLNRSISKTLEEIAQTVFKSWFVDFDPVKAKLAGEKPVGMDDATSALFPDSMENSELGMVPKGWTVHKLGDVCSTAIGGLWGKDSESADSPSPYRCIRGIDMDDLKHIGFAPRTPLRWDKAHNHERRSLNGLSILIAGSGAGPVGKSLLWDESMSGLFDGPVIYSNFVKRFECESRAIASFVSSVLSQMYSSGEMFIYVNGTSVPNLQDAELLNAKKIVLPSEGVLQKFDSLIRLNANLKFNGNNRTLAETRDALLPRLISGELQIPEEMLVS